MPTERPQRTRQSSSVNSAKAATRRAKAWLVHLCRAMLLVGIVFAARKIHQRELSAKALRADRFVTLEQVKSVFDRAASIDTNSVGGLQSIYDTNGEQIGFALQTAPLSDSIIGYVGPTNTRLFFDSNGKLTALQFDSADTIEHVDLIEKNEFFNAAFVGKTWQQAANVEVDAVSGATLTAHAIIAGIRKRLGGTKPSLKFPGTVTIDELKTVFESAVSFEARESYPLIFNVLDANENRVGAFVRTSPSADAINGYQGPSDVFVFLNDKDRVIKIDIRSSFDNSEPEPFVQYVKDESYFMELLAGQSPNEIAAMDLDEVEGVSGATMTSSGVMSAVKFAVAKAIEEQATPQQQKQVIAFDARNIGTICVLIAALFFCFRNFKHKKKIRIAFQLVLIVYFGFLNGDLISQTIFAGWSQNGIPWQHSIGLTCLLIASMLIPFFAKQNLYCHQVCPFGAAQQLVRLQIKKPFRLPRWLTKLLEFIPSILLCVVFCTLFFGLSINLAAIEPFDAFSIKAAGIATIVIAIAGLVASFFVPMAYCRFGCPTGAIFQFLRRSNRSDRLTPADLLAFLLFAIAILMLVKT